MTDTRPQVTAYFDEPDEASAPFFLAIGRAVLAVSGLEKMLLLEIAGLLTEHESVESLAAKPELGEELSKLERLTAGGLLRELRKLDLAPDLDKRIGDVIDRRNNLIHHLGNDPQVIKALAGDGMDAVVTRIEQLALDSAALAAELHVVAAAKLEAMVGKSQAELFEIFKAVDPMTIENADERRQVEAIQELGDIELPTWPSEPDSAGD
jgi:hypothetical protein